MTTLLPTNNLISIVNVVADSLSSIVGLASWIAFIFVPKTDSGIWSWHPLKRLLALFFLPILFLVIIFLWPVVLFGWLLRSRCYCASCLLDDDLDD